VSSSARRAQSAAGWRGTGRHLARVALPYVFRHLVTELAAMNIRCALAVR